MTGNVTADDTLFDITGLEGTLYGPGHASAGALGLDMHTVTVTVLPSRVGEAPEVSIEPPNDQVSFAITAQTVDGLSNRVVIKQEEDISYTVSGYVTGQGGEFTVTFPLSDSALFAAGTFKTLLREEGIRVRGAVRKARTPGGTRIVAEVSAPDISSILTEMNANGLNVVADNLFL